jgi:hypothetical protein
MVITLDSNLDIIGDFPFVEFEDLPLNSTKGSGARLFFSAQAEAEYG